MKTLSIVRDFSPTPGPRYENEGDFSGETFRREVLRPAVEAALRNNDRLQVILDGTAGYGTSFLEEAFGGLVREDHFDAASLRNTLTFISKEEPYLVDDILSYIDDAAQVAA